MPTTCSCRSSRDNTENRHKIRKESLKDNETVINGKFTYISEILCVNHNTKNLLFVYAVYGLFLKFFSFDFIHTRNSLYVGYDGL